MSAGDRRAELGRVEQAILVHEALRGIVPDEQIEDMLRVLVKTRTALQAEVSVHAGARSVVAGRDIVRSTVITGPIHGSVYFGPTTDDPDVALRIYHEVLASACSDVPLRAVDVAAADAAGPRRGMDLAAIYVDLDTTTIVDQPPNKGAPRGLSEHPRSLRALEAVGLHRRLVLLGDPGSGKSTFVTYLARCLAAAAADPGAGWLARLKGWARGGEGLVPILVILRDFARALPPTDEPAAPHQLWTFVSSTLRKQNLAFAEAPLLAALEAGRALVLLDGLDEVPSNALRSRVRDAAAAFMTRYPRSDFMVTCRTLSYHDPAWQLPEIPSFTLAPFDDVKIARFVDAWHAELERRGVISAQESSDLAAGLGIAVQRPDLARLAPSPLLLTAMAIVHTSRGRLPDARARLYEETVDLLLWHREELKSRQVRALLEQVGLADTDLKRVLCRVAFDAHGAAPSGPEDGEALAGIEEHRLEQAIAFLHPQQRGRDWAHDLVLALKQRAGLLLERAPGVYTFPHRTFQEYLAGAHLSAREDFVRCAAALGRQGAQWWEVILLAVGRLVHVDGNVERPLALAAELCPARARDDEEGWRSAWLASEVLGEVGVSRIDGSQLGADLAERVPARLSEILQGGKLSTVERARAGDALAKLGDPRFDAEAWWLPREGVLGFVEVLAGNFWMGSDRAQDPWAYSSEMPRHEVYLPGYWVGKYPVTVAQYRAYVEDSGHRPVDARCLRGAANHPVVWVTWEEALRYAEWLTEKLQGWEHTPEPLAAKLRAGWRVRLPSEAEWEKAARGKDGRIYPWGNNVDAGRANYDDTGIGRTSAVGCFRTGVSPWGCEEMSGNVWEWTRSTFLNYPYQVGGKSEESSKGKPDTRVVRGGAFCFVRTRVRCAVRLDYANDSNVVGFRVIVAPYS